MATAKKKLSTRFKDWFRGMKSELKKVVWPTRKQTINNSFVVFVTVIVTSVVVWGIDSLASGFVRVLIELFG